MGTFKKKKLILMTTVADYTIGCTATGATKCTSAGACCAGFTKVTAVADVPANVVICIPAGTTVATAMTIPTQTGITADKLTAGKGYPLAACPAATTGASALAVSAVAAATAVYMM